MSASAYDAIAGQDLPKHGHVIYGSDYNGSNPLGYPFKVNSSTGSLYVELVGSSTSGTQYIESEALGALPTGTLSMARVTGTLSTIAAIEDDAASLRVSTRGALWTTIDGTVAATQSGTWTIGNAAGASAVNIQDGGNSITVDGTVAATQSGTWNIATVTTVSTVTSLTQFNGVAIALNTGTRSTGTLRVTIATDDIVPVSQSGTWNIATVTAVTTVSTVTSLTQMNGVAIAMGTGTRSAGTQRVTIATDDIVPASQSGTWNIATVTTVTTVSTLTNQSQMGGQAIAMGTGTRSVGTQRVTIATDDIVPVSQSGTWIISANSGVDIGDVTINNATGASAVNIQDGGNSITVDGTVAATQSGTWNIATVTAVTTVSTVTSLTQFNGVAIALNTGTRSTGTLRVTIATDDIVPASQSGTWNIATVTTVTTVSTVSAFGISTTGPMKAEDVAHVTGDMGIAVWAVANEANTARAADGDYIAFATDTEGNTRVVGNRDHDAVDAGEVVATGGQAIAHGTNPTAVAAADRTRWYFNRAGVPFVMGGHPNIVTVAANYTAAQTDTAIVTVAGGLKIVVTRVTFTSHNATTVNVGAYVGFGTANTPTTTGVVLTHPGVAPGSGIQEGNGSGILGVGGDGEDLRITCDAATTGACRVVVSYYTIES